MNTYTFIVRDGLGRTSIRRVKAADEETAAKIGYDTYVGGEWDGEYNEFFEIVDDVDGFDDEE